MAKRKFSKKISENATPSTPEYRLRRKKGEEKGAVRFIGLDGRWIEKIFPGSYDSKESLDAYREFCEVWVRTNGEPVASPLPDEKAITIQDIAKKFFAHLTETHTNRGSIHPYKDMIQNLFDAGYRLMRGMDFDVKALKGLQRWLAERYDRKLVNRRITKARTMIRYACEEGLLPSSQYHALLCVQALPKNSTRHERPPVKAAPDEDIQAIIPYLHPLIKILVVVHRYCGARPGEILRLNTKEMNMRGEVWSFTPEHHKLAHRGTKRTIFLRTEAVALLKPLVDDANRFYDGYFFSPIRVEDIRRGREPGAYQPNPKSKKPKGHVYETSNYDKKLKAACIAAGVPVFSSNQLRHSYLTEINERYGIEAAAAVGGHAKVETTAVYIDRTDKKAKEVANSPSTTFEIA